MPVQAAAQRPDDQPDSFAELTGVAYPQSMVDYVIPNLDRDRTQGIYLTMALARQQPDPLVRQMYTRACEYFQRLEEHLTEVRAGKATARTRVHRMAAFPEAVEIGFGYSRDGWEGRGVGRGRINRQIVDSLLDYPGLSLACMHEPDAVSFIDQVGLDRTSDAMATIVKENLIRFTQKQANRYGFDADCIQAVDVPNVWDPDEGRLVTKEDRRLPALDGEPILLVPKKIVRSSPPVRPEQYARMYRLSNLEARELKRAIMEQNREEPDRLLTVMREIFEDASKYQPRREFRD